MAITIDGSANTVAGLAEGGLPDGKILPADLKASSGTAGSGTYYRGDGAWGTITPNTSNLKIETAGYNCEDAGNDHDEDELVFTVGDGCVSWTITFNQVSSGGNDEIKCQLGYGGTPTYPNNYLGNFAYAQTMGNGTTGITVFDRDDDNGKLNHDWQFGVYPWISVIRGTKTQSASTGHIWIVDAVQSVRNSVGVTWQQWRTNLGDGNGRLTALKVSTSSATGFDAGTVGYQGILEV